MITKEKLFHQLHIFSMAQGKPVMVHTSMKAVGAVEEGAEGLLDVLKDFFTQKGGHLLVPTHTWDKEVYDRRKAETCLGALPTVAAKHPSGVRSLHPTHSVKVFGDEAAQYAGLDEDVDTPVHPSGCTGTVIQEGGFVLLIGVGHDKNTCIHCVEEMLCVKNRLTKEKVMRKVIHRDGREEEKYLYWFNEEAIPDVSDFFPKLEPAFRFHGCILDGFVGNAAAQLVDADKMKKVITEIYKNADGTELMDNDTPLAKHLYTALQI